jgi:hypothetical protein
MAESRGPLLIAFRDEKWVSSGRIARALPSWHPVPGKAKLLCHRLTMEGVTRHVFAHFRNRVLGRGLLYERRGDICERVIMSSWLHGQSKRLGL